MEQSEIETRLIRLSAYIAVLEAALVAVLDHLPNQTAALHSMEKAEKNFDELALAENFSDEELDAYQAAREKFISLVTKRGN
ncbi:hypothetical protein [Iodobacter fluviatilis]|uniref:Uncharacterized protein n=1 Tax=Iodobacter fluviatilis TaxID=537 RepID=A0A7G3G7W7_9NEIS|nr:hypothetical protein [Iodobacter fluviatilis]QBC43316.1 hypothetical protein C1H71_07025 [Iodobacter fluviatilis]